MKTEWKNYDVLSVDNITDGCYESVTRRKVPGGYLIYRDIFNDSPDGPYGKDEVVGSGTVIFVACPNHDWEIMDICNKD